MLTLPLHVCSLIEITVRAPWLQQQLLIAAGLSMQMVAHGSWARLMPGTQDTISGPKEGKKAMKATWVSLLVTSGFYMSIGTIGMQHAKDRCHSHAVSARVLTAAAQGTRRSATMHQAI